MKIPAKFLNFLFPQPTSDGNLWLKAVVAEAAWFRDWLGIFCWWNMDRDARFSNCWRSFNVGRRFGYLFRNRSRTADSQWWNGRQTSRRIRTKIDFDADRNADEWISRWKRFDLGCFFNDFVLWRTINCRFVSTDLVRGFGLDRRLNFDGFLFRLRWTHGNRWLGGFDGGSQSCTELSFQWFQRLLLSRQRFDGLVFAVNLSRWILLSWFDLGFSWTTNRSTNVLKKYGRHFGIDDRFDVGELDFRTWKGCNRLGFLNDARHFHDLNLHFLGVFFNRPMNRKVNLL